MSRVIDVEPMIDKCQSSLMYGKPFGVILHFGNTTRRYSNFNLALCANLTPSQRIFIKNVKEQTHETYSERR